MYSLDRDEVAKILEISTRTVDRYIRSWKIRSQKKWKKIFLNDQDIEIIKNWWIQEEYEVIKPREKQEVYVSRVEDWAKSIKILYEEAIKAVEKKDDVIKDLSYRLWRAEVELKNSIPLLEYKKTTFLLETTSQKTEEEKKELVNNLESTKEKLRNQELINLIMVWVFTIMLIVVFLVWFASI